MVADPDFLFQMAPDKQPPPPAFARVRTVPWRLTARHVREAVPAPISTPRGQARRGSCIVHSCGEPLLWFGEAALLAQAQAGGCRRNTGSDKPKFEASPRLSRIHVGCALAK